MPPYLVGIDLGTTNTVVVSSDRGHYPVVPHTVETAAGAITRETLSSLAVRDAQADRFVFGFDAERLNVHGGAIALGHPSGCTGARIVVTLLHAMRNRDARLGLATLCVAGGMGGALLLEREG